jgi:hypothetical protein
LEKQIVVRRPERNAVRHSNPIDEENNFEYLD